MSLPPRPIFDTRRMSENAASVTGNVLTNDRDPEGEQLALRSVNGVLLAGATNIIGVYGTLVVQSDGSYEYFLNDTTVIDGLLPGDVLQDQFLQVVADSAGNTASSVLVISIEGRNDAPRLLSDNFVVGLSPSLTSALIYANVLTNDTDAEGGPLVVVDSRAGGVVAPAGTPLAGRYGQFTVFANGNVFYQADPNQLAFRQLAAGVEATDTVTVSVADPLGAVSRATLTARIVGSNDAPEPVDDTAAMNEDQAEVRGNLLRNDRDIDRGDRLEVASVNGSFLLGGTVGVISPYGTLVVQPDGSYRFVLDRAATQDLGEGETVTVPFTYTVTDNSLIPATATATLTITITGRNDRPIVTDDVGTLAVVDSPAPLVGNVLSNDTDPDGDTLTVTVVQGDPANVGTVLQGRFGTLQLNADGSYTYRLDPLDRDTIRLAEGQTAIERFSYRAEDPSGASDGGVLTITIIGRNDAPVATGETRTITEDAATATVTGNLLANDRDPDAGSVLTITGVNGSATVPAGPIATAFGFVQVGADGSYSYTLDNTSAAVQALGRGQTATDLITYVVSDGAGGAAAAILTITIRGANDAPTAAVVGVSVREDITPTASGSVFSVIQDADGDAMTVTQVAGRTDRVGADVTGQFGVLRINADGTYTYTLTNSLAAVQALGTGQALQDSFTLRVRDAQGASTTTSLVVTINGTDEVNQSPVLARPLADQNGSEGTAFSFTIPADTFTDVDTPILTYSATRSDGRLLPDWLSFDAATRTFTGAPPQGSAGTVSIGVTVSDGETSVIDVFDLVVAPTAQTALINFSSAARVFASDVQVPFQSGQFTSVAALAGGGFVVIWRNLANSGPWAITGQIYDSGGAPQGTPFEISGPTFDQIVEPAVTALSGGGFVVTWSDFTGTANTRGAFARQYDAGGNALGSVFQVNTSGGFINEPSVASFANGEYIIVWANQPSVNGSVGIYAQRYNASGTAIGGEFRVDSTSQGANGSADIVSFNDGSFLVVWAFSDLLAGVSTILGQRFDASGAALGGQFQVPSPTTVRNLTPQAAVLADGGFVITWWGSPQNTSFLDEVFAQRYDASGVAIGGVVQVSPPGTYSIRPSIVDLDDGGFLITWTGGLDREGQGDVQGQRFDAAGAPVGGPFRLHADYLGVQQQIFVDSALSVLPNGDVLATWGNFGQAFVQRFSLDRTFQGNEDTLIRLPILVDAARNESVQSVTLSGLPAGSVLSAGTTTDGGQTWTFAGPPPVNLSFTPPADYNGSFTLTVTAITTEGSSTATATGTQLVVVNPVDDVPPALPVLTVVSTGFNPVTEGDGEQGEQESFLFFTISRTGDLSQASTVTFTLGDGGGGGLTASEIRRVENGTANELGVGFGPFTVQFEPGQANAAISVFIQGDRTIEPDDTVRLTLTGATGAVLSTTGPVTATGTILNDDVPPALPTVTVAATTGSVAEGNGQDGEAESFLIFTITRSGDLSQGSTVTFTLGDGGGGGLTASEIRRVENGTANELGVGFGPFTVQFEPGQANAAISVFIQGDRTIEPDDTVRLTLTGATGAVLSTTGPITATGTILNDDVPPALPVLTVVSTGINPVTEGNGEQGEEESALFFTISRTGDLSLASTVTFTLGDGGGGGLAAGEIQRVQDGAANLLGVGFGPFTVQFEPGQANAAISVFIQGDRTIEPDDTVRVTLTAATDAVLSTTGPVTATGTILNDDFPGPVLVSPIADQRGTEGTSFTYTVPAGAFTDSDTPVLAYSATLDGSIVLPSWLSFDPVTRTFSGTPPQGSAGVLTIRVTASDGNTSASDVFELEIAGAASPATITVPTQIDGREDTALPLTGIVITPAAGESVSEVVLSGFPPGTVLSAGAPSNNGQTWTFAGPLPTGLSAQGPQDLNGSFSLTVQVTTRQDGTTVTASATTTYVIGAVNDAPFVDVLIPDTTAREGTAFVFEIPEDTFADPEGDFLLREARLANGDPLPSWLSFDATTGTFTGTPPAGSAGTLTITVSAVDTQFSASDTFTLRITAGAPTVAFSASTFGASEGLGTLTFTLRRTGDVTDPLTVTLNLAPGATDPAGTNDFVSPFNFGVFTVTFAANADTATVELPVERDSVVEPDETVTLSLQPGTGYTLSTTGPTTATGIIRNDDLGDTVLPAAIRFGSALTGVVAADVGDIRVNGEQLSNQQFSGVAALSGGGYVVTYSSALFVPGAPGIFDPNQQDIFARRFDSAGNALGPDVRVNTTTAGSQFISTIAPLSNGGYVIVWSSEASGTGSSILFGQRFAADGSAQGGEFQVSSVTDGPQSIGGIVGLPGGGFAIAFTWARGTSDPDTYVRQFNSLGQPIAVEARANSTTVNAQGFSDLAALSDGSVVVVWTSDGQNGALSGVYGQRFDAGGLRIGGEFLISDAAVDLSRRPSITGLSDGGFVVTFEAFGTAGPVSGTDIYAQRFDAAGIAQGARFLVNTTTNLSQDTPHVVALASGGFVISWNSQAQDVGPGATGPNSVGVYARVFDAAGNPVGGETRLNGATAGSQLQGAFAGPIAALSQAPDGTLAATFWGEGDVFLRRFVFDDFRGSAGAGPISLPISVTPTDPGDTVTQVVLQGFPVGSVIQGAASSSGDGTVWVFNGPPPAALAFTPPAGFSGTFTLTVTARTTDGAATTTATGTRAVTVEAGPANTRPIIVSGGGTDFSGPPSIFDNQTVVTRIEVVDPDGPARTLSLSGPDAALFRIDQTTGDLSFISTPDVPPGAQLLYNVTVTVTDPAGATDVQSLLVTVFDLTPVGAPAVSFGQSSAVRLVSQSTGGGPANGGSFGAVFSPDGSQVAFLSRASNLVAGDTNGRTDVFIQDLATGAITRVTGNGVEGNGDSSRVAFDPTGQRLVFVSQASNLVSGDSNSAADLFVYDLNTGAVSRLNLSALGLQPNGNSFDPVFSPDGSRLAFTSFASNLVAGDSNGTSDVFVLDIATGAVTRVSVPEVGGQTNGASYGPAFSADGLRLILTSNAGNLVPGDTNGVPDVFVVVLSSGEVTRVSVNQNGDQATGQSDGGSFAAVGPLIGFRSIASNLVASDTNAEFDSFVVDLSTGVVTRVSTNAAGDEVSDGDAPVFSPDGRYIVFASFADNITAGGPTGTLDLYLRDLQTGEVRRISQDVAGFAGNDDSFEASFSPDGTRVLFRSSASNFTVGDTNGVDDIFIVDVRPPFTGTSSGPPIALPISVATTDPGDVISFVELSGLPPGSVLSDGVPNPDGSVWTFIGPPPANLTVTPPSGYQGVFALVVTATSDELGVTATTVAAIAVTVGPLASTRSAVPTGERLAGGVGSDLLIGGAGTDTFVLGATSGGVDIVRNFVSGSDLIELPGSAFSDLQNVGITVTTGTQPTGLDPQLVFDPGSGLLWYYEVSLGLRLIAQLEGATAVSSGDFFFGTG